MDEAALSIVLMQSTVGLEEYLRFILGAFLLFPKKPAS